VVLDLGVGTGMLSVGAIAYEPSLLIGVDIDPDALHQCNRNIRELFVDEDDDQAERPNYELILGDVRDDSLFVRFDGIVDTVLMNPPFGTKKSAGIDMIFLERATRVAGKVVYSLHKSSTRNVNLLFLFTNKFFRNSVIW
jgi:predicted RNA methylase